MWEIILNYIKVFVCGGLICVIAQILIDKTKLAPARILVGAVVLGTILTIGGVYDHFKEFAGSGATVPLTGFGNALAKGVEKAVKEKGLTGVLTGGLTATSAGIALAISLGWVSSLFFKGKEK
ncbi:stage V sporulation protein AE [Clostridia bacterium]|nr:stage V sporulation protein AE [Clostridia bacterium]GHV11972.1 stage V sporulation protein AE [Clostridia bacterium]